MLFRPPVFADISLPPFTTILLMLGALLVVLALAGQITIKQLRVGIQERVLRIVAGIIGSGLICAAVWLAFGPAGKAPSSTSVSNETRTVSSPLTQGTIPVERYKDLVGKWSVTEKVRPEYGGYEIIWSYDAFVQGNQITMTGKKTFVNERDEPGQTKTRDLTDDEKATVSVCTIILAGFQGEGTFEEKSPHETIRGNLKIRFSDNLMSFSGTAGEDVSTIIGSKQ